MAGIRLKPLDGALTGKGPGGDLIAEARGHLAAMVSHLRDIAESVQGEELQDEAFSSSVAVPIQAGQGQAQFQGNFGTVYEINRLSVVASVTALVGSTANPLFVFRNSLQPQNFLQAVSLTLDNTGDAGALLPLGKYGYTDPDRKIRLAKGDALLFATFGAVQVTQYLVNVHGRRWVESGSSD